METLVAAKGDANWVELNIIINQESTSNKSLTEKNKDSFKKDVFGCLSVPVFFIAGYFILDKVTNLEDSSFKHPYGVLKYGFNLFAEGEILKGLLATVGAGMIIWAFLKICRMLGYS